MHDFPTTQQLLNLLNIQYPIIGAPMAGVSGGDLAASVSLAGGFGFLQVGYQGTEFLINELEIAVLKLERAQVYRNNNYNSNETRSLPFGIGLITWTIKEDLFNLVLEANPKAIWFSFGNYLPWLTKLRQRLPNCIVFVQVDNVQEAIQAAKDGVEIVVLQGLEAGGHRAKIGLSALTLTVETLRKLSELSIKENLKLPHIVTAGGIVDFRGFAGALAVGAQGVVLGSAIQVSKESLLNETAKQLICDTEGSNLATTTTQRIDKLRKIDWDLDRYTARVLRNQLTEGPLITNEEYEAKKSKLDKDYLAVFVGMGIGSIKEILPVQKIIDKILLDYYYNYLQVRTRRQWIYVPKINKL